MLTYISEHRRILGKILYYTRILFLWETISNNWDTIGKRW